MTLKLNGSSSGYTAIDAPAAAGSNTLVLPPNNGSANQVLKTDGSGNLTWVDASSLVSNSPSIAVTRSSAWTVPHTNWKLIPYNQTLWNVGGGTWTAASNSDADGSYYTVPSGGAGKYCVSFGIGVDNLDANEILQMRIAKNGGTTGTWAESLSLTASNVRIQSTDTNYRQFVNNTLCIELADGDKIQPQVQHEEGSDQAHTFMNSLSSAHFSMFRLGGV